MVGFNSDQKIIPVVRTNNRFVARRRPGYPSSAVRLVDSTGVAIQTAVYFDLDAVGKFPVFKSGVIKNTTVPRPFHLESDVKLKVSKIALGRQKTVSSGP